jgi:hypothetical protein
MGSIIVSILIVLEVMYFFYHQRFRSTLVLMNKLKTDPASMRVFLHFQMGRLVCTILFSVLVFIPLVVLSWGVPIWYAFFGTLDVRTYAICLLLVMLVSMLVGNIVTHGYKLPVSHWFLVLKSYAVCVIDIVLLILLYRAL